MAKIEKQIFTAKNGKQFEIRALLGSDAEAFTDFRMQLGIETTNTWAHPEQERQPTEEMAKRLSSMLESRSRLCLGVLDQNKVVGNLTLFVVRDDHPWAKHVGEFGMGILEEFWGLGLGTQLLKIQEAFAHTIGVTRIEGTVRSSNARGLALYQKNGFAIEGERKNCAFINGQYQHETLIAKILD